MQIYMNSYFISSISDTFFRLHPSSLTALEESVRITEDPELWSIVNTALPGVWTYFIGEDFTTRINITVTDVHSFVPNPDSTLAIDVAVLADMQFSLAGSSLYTLQFQFATAATLKCLVDLDNQQDQLFMPTHFFDVQVGEVWIINSFFGRYQSGLFQGVFNAFFQVMRGKLNRDLRRRPVQVPTDNDYFTLHNSEIVFFQDFIEIGTDLKFKR